MLSLILPAAEAVSATTGVDVIGTAKSKECQTSVFNEAVGANADHNGYGFLMQLKNNPMRCNLTDASETACGGRGKCVSVTTAYDGSRWSRTEDDQACFWLMFLEQDPDVDHHGLCLCEGNFDLESCASCQPGWTGADCDEALVAQRRSLATVSADEFSAFGNVGELLLGNRVGSWMHNMTNQYLFNSTHCPGAPNSPHFSSPWLIQWHRPFMASLETAFLHPKGVHLDYWDLADLDGALDIAYRLHPEVEAGGCPRVPLPTETAGLVQQVIDASDYATHVTAMGWLHVYIHMWFCAARFQEDGCNFAGADDETFADFFPSVMLHHRPETTDEEVATCLAVPIQKGGEHCPLFWAFHVFLDRLFEQWQMKQGYGVACSNAVFTSGWASTPAWQTGLSHPAPSSCLGTTITKRWSMAIRDTCTPTQTLGYEYVYAPATSVTHRHGVLTGLLLGGAALAIMAMRCSYGYGLAARSRRKWAHGYDFSSEKAAGGYDLGDNDASKAAKKIVS